MADILDLNARIARLEEALADAAAGAIQTVEVTGDDPFSSLETGFNILIEDLRDEIAATAELNRELDNRVAERTAELEEKLRTISEQHDVIRRQQDAILELSTPVLQVWNGVLALPVIGEVDTRRGAQITESLLEAIARRKARFVIIDITGVEIVDTNTANHFLRTIKAAELLGVQCVLTGVRPPVAKTMVALGTTLSEVCTRATLQQGLEYCMGLLAQEDLHAGRDDDESREPSGGPEAERG